MASDAAERIEKLANLCVVTYVTHAEEIDLDALTNFAAASVLCVRSMKKKKRRGIRSLLRSRKEIGEYATLVRRMYEEPTGQGPFARTTNRG